MKNCKQFLRPLFAMLVLAVAWTVPEKACSQSYRKLYYTTTDGSKINCYGALSNEQLEDGTWCVTYENDLTWLPKYYFYNKSNLKSVVLPSELSSISEQAFEYCTSLESVTFGNSVTSIGEAAFEYCTSLKSITLPSSLTSVGSYCFYECYNLETLLVNGTGLTLPDYFCYYCEKLKTVELNGVKKLELRCFDDCYIESVKIGSELETIEAPLADNYVSNISVSEDNPYFCAENNVLYDKEKTTLIFCGKDVEGDFVVPETVTNLSFSAFYHSTKLTSITLPATLTELGGGGINPNGALRKIICNAVTPPSFSWGYSMIAVPLFVPASSLSAYKSSYVWNYFAYIYPICPLVDGIAYVFDDETLTASVSKRMEGDYEGVISIPATVVYGEKTYSVTSILEHAFDGCSTLTRVNMPSTINQIGDDAFRYCEALETVQCEATTPPSTMSSNCFYDYDYMKLLLVPYASISDYQSVYPWHAFKSIKPIGTISPVAINGLNYELLHCDEATQAVVIKGEYTGDVTVPASVTYNDITFPVVAIEREAFRSSTVTSVNIEAQITEIRNETFAFCSNLGSVTLPASLKYIRSNAFYYCRSLSDLVLPASLEEIDDYAFYNDSGLGTITCLAPNPPYVSSYAFAYAYPRNFTLYVPDEYYSNYRYYGWGGINNVYPIGYFATEEIDGINYMLFEINDTRYAKVSAKPSTIGHSLYAGDIVIPESVSFNNVEYAVTAIDDEAFFTAKDLISVTLPASIDRIGTMAFAHCVKAKSINIPTGVTQIGDGAFAECLSLSHVTIPSSVTKLGYSTFYKVYLTPENLVNHSTFSDEQLEVTLCDTETEDGLLIKDNDVVLCRTYATDVVIPEGITAIRKSAFSTMAELNIANESLRSVIIPSSVVSIGRFAFAGCKSLTELNLPGSITSIDANAFYACTNLTKVNIPDGVSRVSSELFRESGITSITIPSGVTQIDYRAFAGCTALASVSCTSLTPPAVYTNSFDNVSRTIPVYVPGGVEQKYSNVGFDEDTNTVIGWAGFSNFKPAAFDTEGNLLTELIKNGRTYEGGDVVLDDATGLCVEKDFIADKVDYSRLITGTNLWGTLCLPFEIEADAMDGVTIYTLTEATDEVLTLAPVVGTIAAGTPVIFKRGEEVSSLAISQTDVLIKANAAKGTSADGLSLKGTFSGTEITDGYYLAQDGIYSAAAYYADQNRGVTIKPFRAWFSGSIASGARQLSIDVDDEPTSLDAIPAIMEGEAQIFDLNGVLRESLQPGMNIVRYGNGRIAKVMVK